VMRRERAATRHHATQNHERLHGPRPAPATPFWRFANESAGNAV
jgi:hypothetical protein